MSVLSGCMHGVRTVAMCIVLVALAGIAVRPAAAADQPALTEPQLEQLVAPIALYPDSLLAQVLTASTYPLEVVMAARWAKDNPGLKGQPLEDAMQQQTWDPSVKALTAVPQVLQMLSDKLDWTQQLGDAFLAQPDDITKVVQGLRAKAEAKGNLKSTPQQKVVRVAAPPPTGPDAGPDSYIEIDPVDPDVVYVPIYDPGVVYGGWDYPDYAPFYWYPPGYVAAGVFGFGAAFVVGPALYYHYDWGSHHVMIDEQRYDRFNRTKLGGNNLTWQHDPGHRGNIPYRNATLQQKFGTGAGGNRATHGRTVPGANANTNLNVHTNVNTKPNVNLKPNTTNLNTNVNTNATVHHDTHQDVHHDSAVHHDTTVHTTTTVNRNVNVNRTVNVTHGGGGGGGGGGGHPGGGGATSHVAGPVGGGGHSAPAGGSKPAPKKKP